MSFILDALKKSDAERQRQNTPSISDVADGGERRSSPRWLWILGALLCVNLLVLAVVLLRPDAEPVAREAVTRVVPAREETIGGADADESSASFSDMDAEAKKRQPASPAEETPAASTMNEQAQPTTTAVAPVAPPTTLTRAYPTFNEVRAGGLVHLPDLHLDIHVYSEQPGDRFVFVNMSKYTEFTSLAEGPMVKEIVPEGVILEHLGNEFLLPRQ